MSLPKHRERAVQAIAEHVCSVSLTDGFCGPRDGKCQRQNNLGRLDCCRLAEGCVHAMETRGMSVVWDHDPGRHPDPMIDAAERAAIEGL